MSGTENRVAVVTGAGRGIGLEIARTLAAAGITVAVVSRSEASCGNAAETINAAFPGKAKAYAVDVADPSAVQDLATKVGAELGPVGILVNNAGVTRDTLLLRMKEEDWDEVLDTNLKGAFLMVKAFLRPLMKADQGRIINVASVIGLIGNAGQANYSASKAGLIGFTKAVARELAGRKLTCNAVAPGFITTDMTRDLPDAVKEAVLGKIPLGSFGEAADVAAAVAFLASPAARYITGQVLAVDGGMTM
jgi:3-oxoacyl-[acyl-carrier protein] reductase